MEILRAWGAVVIQQKMSTNLSVRKIEQDWLRQVLRAVHISKILIKIEQEFW